MLEETRHHVNVLMVEEVMVPVLEVDRTFCSP